MNPFARDIWADVEKIRAAGPLVLNVTNYVAANSTANALLALGASPIMTHQPAEIADLVGICGAVVVNMGTPVDSLPEALYVAGECANLAGKSLVFDPVGAGASDFRNDICRVLLQRARPDVIRGNASEILATAGQAAATKGVDSAHGPGEAFDAARYLSRQYGSAVCVSGPTDLVTDGRESFAIANGHSMMTRVTGLGCTASALIGAFAAVNASAVRAAAHAMAVMGIAGEMAAEGSPGPGTLQLRFYDALYSLNEKDLNARLKLEKQ